MFADHLRCSRCSTVRRHSDGLCPHCDEPNLIPSGDFDALQALLGDARRRDPGLAARLEAKLANARVVAPEQIPPDVARLGARLIYRVGSGPVEQRVLVTPQAGYERETDLTVTSAAGLAMLGRRTGSFIPLGHPDGADGRIHLDGIEPPPAAAIETAPIRPKPTAEVLTFVRRARVRAMTPGPDDDPPPTAA